MGVLRDHQAKGIGKKLIEYASKYALEKGATTMTVETLAPQQADVNYLKTYKFYESCGFQPLLNLMPEDYTWEMVYMVKNLTTS